MLATRTRFPRNRLSPRPSRPLVVRRRRPLRVQARTRFGSGLFVAFFTFLAICTPLFVAPAVAQTSPVYNITTLTGGAARNGLVTMLPSRAAGLALVTAPLRVTPVGAALTAATIFGPGAFRMAMQLAEGTTADSDQSSEPVKGEGWGPLTCHYPAVDYSGGCKFYSSWGGNFAATIVSYPAYGTAGPVTVKSLGDQSVYVSLTCKTSSGSVTSDRISFSGTFTTSWCGTLPVIGMGVSGGTEGSGTINHLAGAPASGGGTAPSPERTLTPRSTCQDSSGNVVEVTGARTVFRESAMSSVFLNVPPCPASHPHRKAYGATGTTAGSPDSGLAVPNTAYPAPPSTHPHCVLPGSCALERTLIVPGGSVGTTENTMPEGDYCSWGGTLVSAAECKAAMLPAPDPVTGKYPEPPPDTCVAGTQACAPATGSETDEQTGCGGNFSWNPVSWVVKPVSCVLTWAFVPGPGFVEGKQAEVEEAWADTGPGGFIAAAGNAVTGLADIGSQAGGCSGPAVKFDTAWLKTELRPLAACPGDLAHNAAKVVRIITTVGLYLGLAALCTRVLASSLGLQLPGLGRGDDA